MLQILSWIWNSKKATHKKNFCQKINRNWLHRNKNWVLPKQWPLAPNSRKWRITRANVSRRITFLSKMAFGECGRVWPGRPICTTSKRSTFKTSTTKTSTFSPKTWTVNKIKCQKHRLSIKSNVKNIDCQKHQLAKSSLKRV